MGKAVWEYKFCLKNFKTENGMMKHTCKQMERADEIKSPIGQQAYQIYSEWMKLSNYKVPPIESFVESRYYLAFINFAHFCRKVDLVDIKKYIELMIAEDISPTIWRNDALYVKYLEHIDRKTSPTDQAHIMIECMYKLSESLECPVSDVFDKLTGHHIVELIRKRYFTPWLMLVSTRFKQRLAAIVDEDSQVRGEIENLIVPSYWAKKFNEQPNMIQEMKLIAKELGI